MDQNQAIQIVDNAVASIPATRAEHQRFTLAMALIRELGKKYTDLANAETARVQAAKKATPPAPATTEAKQPIDNADKSEA